MSAESETVATIEQAASIDFEGMEPLDVIPEADFLTRARDAHKMLLLCAAMFRMSRAEMSAAFLKMNKAANDDGVAACGVVQAFGEAREWFESYAGVLGAIEARGIIALSHASIEGDLENATGGA